jgi:hypothetical protein
MSSRGFGRGRGRGFGRRRTIRNSVDNTMNLKKFDDMLVKFIAQNEFDTLDTVLKEYLIDILIPMNIKFNLDQSESGIYLTLNTDRNNAKFNIPLVRQCNGTLWKITKTSKVELLIVSSREFNNRYATADVEQFIKDDMYNILPLEDGTTINIYWDDEWLFATKNSRNCSQIEWRGYKYETVIKECLDLYPDFSLDNLDKSCVYTIGFHHTYFHPFEDSKRVWLIQIYDKINHCIDHEKWIGIPRQSPVSVDLNSKTVLADLTSACENALQTHLTNGMNKSHVLMGYILRSKDENRTGTFSDLLIESNLFQTIKHCIYDLPFIKNKAVRSQVKGKFKNFNYVLVNVWLDFTKEPVFFKIFPQYANYRDRFNSIVEKAIDKMIPMLSNPSGHLETQIHVFRTATDDESATNLASAMMPIIREMIADSSKTLDEPSNRLLIRNLMMNPEYTETFVGILF